MASASDDVAVFPSFIGKSSGLILGSSKYSAQSASFSLIGFKSVAGISLIGLRVAIS